MIEQQKAFLKKLIHRGISMNALIAVGTLITTEPLIKEMTRRILEAEKNGQKVDDGLVGQLLVDMMKDAVPEE